MEAGGNACDREDAGVNLWKRAEPHNVVRQCVELCEKAGKCVEKSGYLWRRAEAHCGASRHVDTFGLVEARGNARTLVEECGVF